jgi:hypothetical protein
MPSLLSQFAPSLSSREGEGFAGDDSSRVAPKVGVNGGGDCVEAARMTGFGGAGLNALLTGMAGAAGPAIGGGGCVLRTGCGCCGGMCAGISGCTGVGLEAVSAG